MKNTAQFIEMLNEILSLFQRVKEEQQVNQIDGIDCIHCLANIIPDSNSFNALSTGKKIRSIRMRKKISVLDVADTCRLSKAAILHYENDIRKPSAAVLTSIADQLNVPPSTLVEYNLHSLNNCIHALFEIEESGAFNSQIFREALALWESKRAQLASGELTAEEYQTWKWEFCISEPDDTNNNGGNK